MDSDSVNSLLWRSEGDDLDFKEEQYPFWADSREEKSEIVKDILAMANAWRVGDAVILIGVKEIRGGRSVPTGVSKHPDDAEVQQLFKNQLNRPLSLKYEVIEIDGVSVGAIVIKKQARPFCLIKKLRGLQAGTVFVRRGSATDEALPDEIAAMGRADSATEKAEKPQLIVSWAGSDGNDGGKDLLIQSDWLSIPEPERRPEWATPFAVPEYAKQLAGAPFNYRDDLRKWKAITSGFRPISLVVRNEGRALVVNIYLELTVPKRDTLSLATLCEIEEAKPNPSDYKPHDLQPRLPLDDFQSGVTVDRVKSAGILAKVRFWLGGIQPGTTAATPSHLYLGSMADDQVLLDYRLTGDNLAVPIEGSLSLSFSTSFSDWNDAELADELADWESRQ